MSNWCQKTFLTFFPKEELGTLLKMKRQCANVIILNGREFKSKFNTFYLTVKLNFYLKAKFQFLGCWKSSSKSCCFLKTSSPKSSLTRLHLPVHNVCILPTLEEYLLWYFVILCNDINCLYSLVSIQLHWNISF